MRTIIAIQYNQSFEGVAAITLPIIGNYARRHGYSLYSHKTDQVSPEIVWQRVYDTMRFIDEFDAVVHLDVDLLITNSGITIEEILAGSDAEYFTGTDWNGMNDGFSVWRKAWMAKQLLQWCSNFGKKYSSPQEAISSHEYKYCEICPLPQRVANSYITTEYGELRPDGEWQEGDFILHIPGRTNERRIEILKNHLPFVK